MRLNVEDKTSKWIKLESTTLESVKKNVDSAYMTVEVLATKEVPVEIEYMGVPEDGYMAAGEVESSVPTVRIAGTVSHWWEFQRLPYRRIV